MSHITQLLNELLEHCTPYSGHHERYHIALRHLRTALAQPATNYLEIERSQGMPKFEAAPVPVLYSDSINGCMVRRDDVWLALTSQLAQPESYKHEYVIELPDGDTRETKVWWSQQKATGEGLSHRLSITVSETPSTVVVNADYREMWAQQLKMSQRLAAALAQPEPVELIGKVESAAVACRGFHVVLAEGATMPKIGDLILTAAKKPAKGGAL